MKFFTGNSHPALARDIALYLGIPPGRIEVKRFSDGEVWCEIEENVRGADVFVLQSTCSPVNDNLMELLVIIDALKRASAERITVVLPYYGYARQDRKTTPRTPISAKLVADLLEASGATRVLSMDLHAGQIQGFFNVPFDHLYAMPVVLEWIRKHFPNGEDLTIVSPDAGGVERARAYAKRLKANVAFIDKRRPRPNESEVMHIVGLVDGKDAVILDDMVDTAGTITAGAVALKEQGAKKVFAVATHAVLSGPAISRLAASPIERIGLTNTIPLPVEKQLDKIETITVHGLIGEAIRRIHTHDSISSLFV